jgi:ArsR family transcriptional regulator, arsenate/arsenite/antimonite-responsive transcriptional repressor
MYVNALWQNGGMPKTLPVVDISQPVCCSPVAAGQLDDDAALEIA